MRDVTQLLNAIEAGDRQASEDLWPLIYEELRKLAAVRLAAEKPGQTLQPTALVNEAYVRLVRNGPSCSWNGRGHFFASAAEAMRRILVENARRKKAERHGGGRVRVDLSDNFAAQGEEPVDLVVLDDALTVLSRHHPDAARIVNLRYFAGLSHQQAAEAMGISRGAADRLWALARAWLFREYSK